jgi:hypothetical protein
MNANTHLRLRLANERIARLHRQAADERRANSARHRHQPPLRLRLGRTIIALGERLASEPVLRSARAR